MSATVKFTYPSNELTKRQRRNELYSILFFFTIDFVLLLWIDSFRVWTFALLAIAFVVSLSVWRRCDIDAPLLSISPAGLDGCWIQSRIGRALTWKDVHAVSEVPGAVLVDFEPEDLNSNDHKKRISLVRLPEAENLSATSIIDEIRQFYRPPN